MKLGRKSDKYEDFPLHIHLMDPTFQDTSVSKYNYSITSSSVKGSLIISVKTNFSSSFIQITDPMAAASLFQ